MAQKHKAAIAGDALGKQIRARSIGAHLGQLPATGGIEQILQRDLNLECSGCALLIRAVALDSPSGESPLRIEPFEAALVVVGFRDGGCCSG